MPFYDYKCEDCKNEEEIFTQKILTESSEMICPKCQSKNFKRVYSGNGFHTSFGLDSWKKGLTTEQQASALMSHGTLDGKRIV